MMFASVKVTSLCGVELMGFRTLSFSNNLIDSYNYAGMLEYLSLFPLLAREEPKTVGQPKPGLFVRGAEIMVEPSPR